MTWYWTLTILGGAAWVLAMAVIIVLQRRSAAATLAWLMVLTFLPVVGFAIYRFIGPLRLERKKTRRRRSRKVVQEALGAIQAIDDASRDHEKAELALVGIGAGEAPPLRAAALELYTEGAPAYAAIREAIGRATHHVHLEYYIWEPDHTGRAMLDLLARRAAEGVKVRLLLDAMGAAHVKRRHLRPLLAAGGEVGWFNPVSLRMLRGRRADFRTHRKMVVCDGKVGFTGGMNVSDAHTAEFCGARAWRDTHLRLEGSAVRALQRVFMDDWSFVTDQLAGSGEEYFPGAGGAPGEPIVQILASGPDSTTLAIHRSFFTAMNTAARRLYVTTPYFIPDEAILTALISAALRRIDVKLLIPARGDSRLIDLAARSYLPELLEAGVRVYEYQPRFVHAKTMVVDEGISVVGTANLDNRSFKLNFEVAALVFAPDINQRLAAAFAEDLTQARELTVADLTGAPFLRRLGEATARLLSPLL